MSTSGGYHEACGGGGGEGYDKYIGECSVHQGIPWVHRGDIMSTSGDVQYIGEVSSKLIKPFNFYWRPRCTEHAPMYSWYPPMYWTFPYVLMISPPMYWTFPDVLMISPQCTEHSPMYSWYPPDVLMISPDVLMVTPRCTEHPPMYWTSPDVLNIPRCTEHTLYRVVNRFEKFFDRQM